MTKRFEYNMSNVGTMGTDAFEKHLVLLGENRWQLVGITGNIMIFIREMLEEKQPETPKYHYSHISVRKDAVPEIHTEILTSCGANGWRVTSTKERKKYENGYDKPATTYIDYLLERPVSEGMSTTHNKAGEYIGDDNYNPPKGFVGHVIEGPSIAESNPIPPGIYFRSGNFYDARNGNRGMGIPFYDEWSDRASEFPQNPAGALITFHEAKLVEKDNPNPAEDVFDYSYFMGNDRHTWIKANKIAIMSFINQCWNRNVWFNYYPNANNKEFPWLIIKSGMKNEIVAHAERYGMCIEVIPGEHMTEDKL